jgi:hypothetical protein
MGLWTQHSPNRVLWAFITPRATKRNWVPTFRHSIIVSNAGTGGEEGPGALVACEVGKEDEGVPRTPGCYWTVLLPPQITLR